MPHPALIAAGAIGTAAAPIAGEYIAAKIEEKHGRKKPGEPEAQLARSAGRAAATFFNQGGK